MCRVYSGIPLKHLIACQYWAMVRCIPVETWSFCYRQFYANGHSYLEHFSFIINLVRRYNNTKMCIWLIMAFEPDASTFLPISTACYSSKVNANCWKFKTKNWPNYEIFCIQFIVIILCSILCFVEFQRKTITCQSFISLSAKEPKTPKEINVEGL